MYTCFSAQSSCTIVNKEEVADAHVHDHVVCRRCWMIVLRSAASLAGQFNLR